MKLQVVTKWDVCILISPFCCSAASDLYLHLSIPTYFKVKKKKTTEPFLERSDHVNHEGNLFFSKGNLFLSDLLDLKVHTKRHSVCKFVRVRKSGDVQAFASLE